MVLLAELAHAGRVAQAVVARISREEHEAVRGDARERGDVSRHMSRRVDEVQRAVVEQVDGAVERRERGDNPVRGGGREVDEGDAAVGREDGDSAVRVDWVGVLEQRLALCAKDELRGGKRRGVACVVPVQVAIFSSASALLMYYRSARADLKMILSI